MPHTQGTWTMDGAPNDGQIFIDPYHLWDSAGHAVLTEDGSGLINLALAATLAGTFRGFKTAMNRTGVYATPSLTQEQFGTAASLPGPTTVANTSGPLAQVGFPPTLAAQLSTLAGPVVGPTPKGIQINSMDIIYSVLTANASLATCGITKTVFVDNTAPAVSNIIAVAANGMPVAFRAQPYVFNVPVPAPSFLTPSDSEPIVQVNLTAGAGGTIKFWGVVLYVSFNYN